MGLFDSIYALRRRGVYDRIRYPKLGVDSNDRLSDALRSGSPNPTLGELYPPMNQSSAFAGGLDGAYMGQSFGTAGVNAAYVVYENPINSRFWGILDRLRLWSTGTLTVGVWLTNDSMASIAAFESNDPTSTLRNRYDPRIKSRLKTYISDGTVAVPAVNRYFIWQGIMDAASNGKPNIVYIRQPNSPDHDFSKDCTILPGWSLVCRGAAAPGSVGAIGEFREVAISGNPDEDSRLRSPLV